MKQSLFALLLAVCLLLASCTASAPAVKDASPTEYERKTEPLTEIDRCAVEPGARERMSDKDMLAYRTLMEAMLARRDSVRPEVDTVTAAYLLDLLRRSPYYYFLSDAEEDGGEVRFTYAYSAEEQAQMLSFIDDELLKIVNFETKETDNELDIILKIYLAVTHGMTYDSERTDNKMLGSPLFDYPADEIYKALRDKKSLCYGFAYVLRFALLQRGVDCFCVYGLCTSRGDGHEWVIFRYGDHWYHCDPTWDRADNSYSKLIHFGKTDREREVDELEISRSSLSREEGGYTDIKCTDDLFHIFRAIRRYSYIGGHRYYMVDNDGAEHIFDTESFSFKD